MILIFSFIFHSNRYADQVSIGDELLTNINEKMIPTKVINVKDQIMQGSCSSFSMFDCFFYIYLFLFSVMFTKVVSMFYLPGAYVPLTEEGNLIVDAVLASCYASFHHDLAHIGMTPIKWFSEAMQWIVGEDDRKLAFVSIIKKLGKWILPYGHLWQTSF